MTLDDLKRQNMSFYEFFSNFGAATRLYHLHGSATVQLLLLCGFGMTAIKMFYFIPNSRESNSNNDFRQIFVVRFCCIVSAIIYYLVHFWCTVFGETACIGLSYSVICDILFDGAAIGNRFTTLSLKLGVVEHLYYSQAQMYITLIDCIDWVVIFLRAKAATTFIAS